MKHLHDARGAGQGTPRNSEAREAPASAPSPKVNTQPDSATADAERKRFEHLRALLALHHGHVVHELAGGGYLVVWRGLSRECRDLAELEAHALRVGAMQ